MARYPSATWKPIGGTGTSPLTPDILCLHTAIGYLRSTWNYFNRPDVGVYSHFCIGGTWGSDAGYNLDGVTWQMADTRYRAAANLDGNWRVISVETADNAARPIEPWTPAQCDAIVALMVDANRLDGIPLTLIPDSKPGRRGIGYHRQGVDPFRADGGELWSSAFAKDCPTQARIDQIPGLIDRARAIVAGQEEDPMAAFTEADIRRFVREEVNKEVSKIYNLLGYGDERTDTKPDTHPENLQRVRAELAALATKVDAVKSAVEALAPAKPESPAPGT